MKNICIIVVTYNGIEWISKCLKSIPSKYQIIVVDNNSTDGTVPFIKENYPSIKLFLQSKNLGFGLANNIGMSYALKKGASYAFLLNQDAYLKENTIDELIEVHKKNKEFGILSPIHLNGTGDKLDFNFSNFIAENKELQYDALKQSFSSSAYEVPFINAAVWLLPRHTLETVGGFDPIFHHYSEDDNYCHRVLYHGLKIGVVPQVYVYHDREIRLKSTDRRKKEKLKYLERKLKEEWCNINIEVEEEMNRRIEKLNKFISKLLFNLELKKASRYKRRLNLVKKVIPEINSSRETNKIPGSHYL